MSRDLVSHAALILSLMMVLGATSKTVASDDPPDDKARLVCTLNGEQVVFMLNTPDVSIFTEHRSDLTLIEARPLPEINATMYRFGPDDIICIAETG